MVARPNPVRPALDLAALKARQHGGWSPGDYAVGGTTLQIVGEALCEVLDLRSGSTVLDVAAGNGNASLAAGAERLGIDFQKAGAENLPFADQRFDVVLSLRRDVHAQSGPRRARDGKRQRQDRAFELDAVSDELTQSR